MSDQTLENEPLESLAQRIVKCANEADERTLEAAQLIRVAKQRVDSGKAGDIKWYAWAEKNIKLSKSRLRELLRIAEAEDPQQELKRLRRMIRERVERHREKQRTAPLRNGAAEDKVSAGLEDERKRLIEWAKSATLGHVAAVLAHAERLGTGEAAPDSQLSAAHTAM